MESIEYQMLDDLDEYILPDYPVSYKESNEYEDIFSQESFYHEVDIQRYHKTGKALTKAESLPESCRNNFHNSMRKFTNYSQKIHEDSVLALRVCKKLIDLNKIKPDQIRDYLGKIVVPKKFCPYAQTYKCNRYSKYRTYDGSCNNLLHPWLGKAETPLKRLSYPRYHDIMSDYVKLSVTGKPLPNPRALAFKIHYPKDVEIQVNTLFVFWGQFIDHDLSFTGLTTGSDGKPKACTCDTDDTDCLNIEVPTDDPIYKNKQKCLVTPRSSASFPRYDCSLGMREQINLLTHWFDLSHVYGISKKDNEKIRLGKDGLLKASSIPGIRYEHLPLAKPNSSACISEKEGSPCFLGVELRLNQNLALLSLHTLLLREHNRIARTLKYFNPRWNDEKIFQEARRISIAQYQHISYNDWIKIVIGKKMSEYYDATSSPYLGYFYGYDRKVNPSISNEFATAAYRFGHTLITSFILKADIGLRHFSNLSLTDELLSTKEAYKDLGLDGVLRGLIRQKATAGDGHITSTLNDHLFRNPDKDAETHEFSLSALNINRARDHGIPSYVKYRKLLVQKPISSFEEMDYMYEETLNDMKSVYEHIDDMDLFTGGLAEKPVEGGLVGPVFASIIAKQWKDLKYGDRHYYENGNDENTRFSLRELAEIKKASIGRLLCDNIDIEHVPKNPWLVDSITNRLVPCDSLPYVDLRVFKDDY